MEKGQILWTGFLKFVVLIRNVLRNKEICLLRFGLYNHSVSARLQILCEILLPNPELI